VKKERLDQLLVRKRLFETRTKAQAAIMAGIVYVDDQKETKSGTKFSEDSKIEIRGEALPYVSRGGLKLEHALKKFDVDPKAKIVLDIGASTGGFTDCLLQKGAELIYAIDVGYGQIAWKLRKDPRVVVIERTNVRYLEPKGLYKKGLEKASLAVIDVSFISLSKILPAVYNLLSDDGEVLALVKPQFEAGREQVERGGLVKDAKVQTEVLDNVVAEAGRIGFKFKDATYSPVTGADGNIEFFLYLAKIGESAKFNSGKLVEEAQGSLKT
jgi:23S rRNA (cytidine1920-2'-O)/16S rRNA (cytidine1409-2'-O)-methyltransferase